MPEAAGPALLTEEAPASDRLLANGAYVMATTVVTSLSGLGFWVLAARAASTSDVGRGAAAVSAMLLVSLVTGLGLGQVMISRLPGLPDAGAWSLCVCTALATTTVTGLVGGTIAALLLPALVPALGDAGATTLALLPVGVAAAAGSMTIDHLCLAVRDARPGFVRNAVMALARFVAVAGCAVAGIVGPGALLACWVVTLVLFDVHALLALLPRLRSGFRPTLDGWRGELVAMRRLIAGHHLINLSAQAATFALPVLVTARLGAADGARFYATWMLAGGLYLIAPALGNALFAEGANAPARLAEHVRRTIRLTVLLAVPAAAGLVVLGAPVLHVFGADYARGVESLLALLVLAGAFDAVQTIVVAILRVREHLFAAAGATGLALVVAVGATWALLPPLGLAGAGAGWAIGRGVGAAAGLVALRRPGARGTARRDALRSA